MALWNTFFTWPTIARQTFASVYLTNRQKNWPKNQYKKKHCAKIELECASYVLSMRVHDQCIQFNPTYTNSKTYTHTHSKKGKGPLTQKRAKLFSLRNFLCKVSLEIPKNSEKIHKVIQNNRGDSEVDLLRSLFLLSLALSGARGEAAAHSRSLGLWLSGAHYTVI